MSVTEKKKYRNNFLSHVICRLDFRPVPEIDKSFLEKFRTEIKKDFPVVEDQSMRGIGAEFKAGKLVKHSELPEKPIFLYKDTNEENLITLAEDHLVIDSLQYVTFKEFRKNIDLVIDTLTSFKTNPDYTRLGLRYINEIVLNRGNPFEWGRYIDTSFVSVSDRFFKKSTNMARMMGQVILVHDDYKVNFNYGMYNSEFPARISRKEFILDYDFYTEYVEQDQIMPLLKKFNKESAIMFEQCIKNGLRKHMEVIDE